MPPCRSAYLINHLLDIGPVNSEGPISHTEIRSWQLNTGIELSSWEAVTLRRLSAEYFGFQHKAKDRACPIPWDRLKETEQETL